MTMQMHTCPRCGAEYHSFEALDHHVLKTHASAEQAHRFRCVTCDAGFTAAAEWLDHGREAH
jgi:uncharacterized C2H2 Zn-finger protein